jgi:hypothetical protein
MSQGPVAVVVLKLSLAESNQVLQGVAVRFLHRR